MKPSIAELTEMSKTPVFPKTFHRLRSNPEAAAPSSKPTSRDTREDRGTRQMKTMQNSQTFPHGR
jgi:hypothetical protein